MSETMVNSRWFSGACAMMLLCGSLAVGQQPPGSDTKPPKSKPAEASSAKSLEDLLGAALKNNPDMRVAEAKVREAEAELNRSRLQVTQKVVTLYRVLEAQKDLVRGAEAEAQRLTLLQQKGFSSGESTAASSQKALQAKAKLSELEAELAYLTGQQAGGVVGSPTAQAYQHWLFASQLAAAQEVTLLAKDKVQPTAKTPASITDRLRKALDNPVKINFENKTPTDILKEFQTALGGVPIRIRTDLKLMQQPLTVKLSEPISLGAAFQLLEDETRHLQFLVREYGIIILHLHQEEPPPGAEGLIDFWKGIARRSPFPFGGRPTSRP